MGGMQKFEATVPDVAVGYKIRENDYIRFSGNVLSIDSLRSI